MLLVNARRAFFRPPRGGCTRACPCSCWASNMVHEATVPRVSAFINRVTFGEVCTTRTGGEHMQQGMVGTAMRALVAVGTLVSAFAMIACGDGGSSQSVSAIVGVTTTTVVAVQTVAFVLPHGQLFTPSLAGAVTVTFNSTPPNTFTLVGTGGATATGEVTYSATSGATVGSCTFTFLTTGDLLSGIGSVTVPSCSLLVRANNVHPGGGQVHGPVTLSLSGAGVAQ